MLRALVICLSILLFTAGSIADAGAAQRRSSSHGNTASQNSGPYCNIAKRCAYLVMDANSGSVLSSSDPDKQVYPASLTKMMTVYLMLEAIESGRYSLNDRVMVSSFATSMPALKIGFREGQSVTIEDLIKAVTVKSANDAAVVIAEALAGNEAAFARQMTIKAHQLGMNRTTFRNASGLPDPGQLSTARDMSLLARHILTDFPRYRRYFGLTEARVAGTTIEGHNRLTERGEIEGGKTGYIRDSGYNMVAWAQRDGRLLIAAVFGGRTYATRDAKVLEVLRGGSVVADTKQLPSATTPTAPSTWNGPAPTRKPGDGIAAVIDKAQINNLTAASAPASPATDEAATLSLPPNVKEVSASTIGYTAPTFANSWAVQVGAYRDAGQAQQALDKATRELPVILGAAYPRTIPTTTNVGQLHRAQIIGLDERQAKAACAVLSRKGMQCLPMPPTG